MTKAEELAKEYAQDLIDHDAPETQAVIEAYLAGYSAAKPRWIKFDELDTSTFPDFGQQIIAQFKDGSSEVLTATEGQCFEDGTYSLDLYDKYEDGVELEDISHYMPLPEFEE